MARGQIQLIDMDSTVTYCRRYDGAAYDDYDAYVDKLPIVDADNQPMMEDAADYMYFGGDSAWYGFGIILSVLGDYGALTWEYWSGAAWSEFTVLEDTTNGFEQHGLILWGTLNNWAETTVDGTECYWVRVSAASVTTAATFFNLLLNLCLSAPLLPQPDLGTDRIYPDINGDLQKTDLTYDGPRHLVIQAASISTRKGTDNGMEGVNLLWKFWDARRKIWITDLARTDPPDVTADAFYRNMIGYIVNVSGNAYSPYKMEPRTYDITFLIQADITVDQAFGATTYTPGNGGWSRVTGTASTATGDGGDDYTGV